MIRKFEKIDNYGIFRKFKWPINLPEFKDVNLFYGLNGSGKSTLSSIFNNIKNKNLRYFNGTFKVYDDEKGSFDSAQLADIDYNIYVFNTHFIEENIVEYNDLKGIVYISEENKTAKEELDLLKENISLIFTKREEAKREYYKTIKTQENDYIKAAKAIKEQFLNIGGVGSKFSNYNKTSFENALGKYSDFLAEIHDLQDILSGIEEGKKSLRDNIKSQIPKIFCNIAIDDFIKEIDKIQKLLSTKVKDCLKKNIKDDIFSWLEEGYRLHKDKQTHCLYCGSVITEERKNELDKIFNDELNSLLKNLEDSNEEISTFKLPELSVFESDFYSSQHERIKKLIGDYKILRDAINSGILEIKRKIDEKIKNPFSIVNIDIDTNFKALNINCIDDLNVEIEEANKNTECFMQKQKETVNNIEKLLVYYNYYIHDIKSHNRAVKKAHKEFVDLKDEYDINKEKEKNFENKLIDVIKAKSEFNKLLSQFLGRSELELEYDDLTKGYKIIRKENGDKAQCLSEGEKSAIAFIYFLTKVKENGNSINNSIIVFDDPISSFDSNHLYNAYSFIVNYFEGCKQLFILTHNFKFFKLVQKKYKKGANMYLIDNKYIQAEGKTQRTAVIIELPKSIKQASSEYSYLFEKIFVFYKNYNSKENIDMDMYLNMSNMCRKVLETFVDFKFQSKQNLYEKICNLYKCNKDDKYKLTIEESIEFEKIYRFINSFSHGSIFEESTEDIILGELYSIVESILKLIERVDKDHYKSMLSAIDYN